MGILTKENEMGRKIFFGILIYTLVIIITLVVTIPFVWMFLSSFKSGTEIVKVPQTFLPKNPTIQNYQYLFEKMNFGRFFLNSILVSSLLTFIILFTSSLTGYVFAKFQFRHKESIFILIISTMMIPFVVIMLPLYVMVVDLGWANNYYGLIIPMALSAFGIFLMRQFIDNIPSALLEAARIDGASEWWIFLRVIIPLSLPAISALGIFSFMWAWNNLLWPLLIINSRNMYTITLAIASLQWESSVRYDVVITGAAMSVIPVLIIYAFANRTFIRGLSLTGLKY
jgi:multiple sugar transport system permease protein